MGLPLHGKMKLFKKFLCLFHVGRQRLSAHKDGIADFFNLNIITAFQELFNNKLNSLGCIRGRLLPLFR